MPGPIATIGSMHVCPMCTGLVPHVGGPVSQGVATVLANGKPVATVGSMCVCVGPPDVIIGGESNVLINGMPVATVNSPSAHGGIITVGESNILINTGAGAPSSLTPVDRIESQEITFTNKTLSVLTGKGKLVKEATEQQQKNQEEAKKHGFLGHFGFSI